MWFRNREIHRRSGWSYWARKGWWIMMDRGSVRVVRDEDMPEELKS